VRASKQRNTGRVLNESDMYREFLPSSHLRHAITCLWLRRGIDKTVRVIPDGCADIVWRPAAGAIMAGPDTRHWFSAPGVDEPMVGVRFRPGAGGPALGVPLSELRDRRVALEDLNPALARSLSVSDDPHVVAKRLAAITAELVTARPPDRVVQAATVQLRDSRVSVDRLADELGVSERQLRRRFHDAVGYGPKTLQRVLRLRRFLAAAGTADIAAAAIDAGYADQAHVTRESRVLTGLTPSDWVRAHRAY
jgi:AraC-like DNA-binding protein